MEKGLGSGSRQDILASLGKNNDRSPGQRDVLYVYVCRPPVFGVVCRCACLCVHM